MNGDKSSVYPMGGDTRSLKWEEGLQIVPNGFKYLGVFITPEESRAWEKNVLPIEIRLKAEILT